MIPITLGEALDKTNNHGRYQILLFLICALFTAQEVFHICLDVVTAKPVPWRWKDEDASIARSTFPPCATGRGWVYSYNETVSIRSEFNLYCNPLMLRLITAAFFIGRTCGFLVFWNISVLFGRRWPIIIAVWCNSIVTWLLSCSASYQVYVVLRALDGFTMEGYVIGSYVLLLECINENSRHVFASQFRSFQGLGLILLAGIAYFSSSWKVTCLICGTLMTFHGAVASVYLPESPRWLLAKGRNGDIVTFIHKVSTCNDRRIKDQFFIIDNKKKRPGEKITSEKELLVTVVSLMCIWALLHVAEYTLYLNILYLPGNAYLNLLLLGVCDIPARAVPLFVRERLGRRPTLLIWNLVAGGLLLTCCVPNNIARCLCYLLAKLVLAGNIILIKVYTHELAPATDNSNIYKWCEFATRIIGCGVPFLLFLNPLNLWLIYGVAGGCVILSSLFIVALPETKGRSKPADVNEFIGLYYGSRFRPASTTRYSPTKPSNGVIPGPRPGDQYRTKPAPEEDSFRTKAANGNYVTTRNNKATSSRTWNGDKAARKADYDLTALSNTDVGNLSVFDPDIHNFVKPTRSTSAFSGATPIANSTPITRPSSLKLSRKPGPRILSRNPSYESSLHECHTVMSTTPDTSARDSEQELVIKRNSLVSFTPKSSVKKNFFSLSRV